MQLYDLEALGYFSSQLAAVSLNDNMQTHSFFFAFAGIFLAVCFFIWMNIMFVPRIYGTFLMFLDRFSYFKQRRWLLPLRWISIFRYREFLSLTL